MEEHNTFLLKPESVRIKSLAPRLSDSVLRKKSVRCESRHDSYHTLYQKFYLSGVLVGVTSEFASLRILRIFPDNSERNVLRWFGRYAFTIPSSTFTCPKYKRTPDKKGVAYWFHKFHRFSGRIDIVPYALFWELLVVQIHSNMQIRVVCATGNVTRYRSISHRAAI